MNFNIPKHKTGCPAAWYDPCECGTDAAYHLLLLGDYERLATIESLEENSKSLAPVLGQNQPVQMDV